MQAMQLLITIRKQGVEVEASGDKLRLVGPEERLADIAATVREHKPELLHLLDDPSTRWRVLAATGLNDQQVIPLDDALFLHALRLIQKATTPELAGIWNHHSPYWRQRLEPEAWQIVLGEYRRLVKCNGQTKGKAC